MEKMYFPVSVNSNFEYKFYTNEIENDKFKRDRCDEVCFFDEDGDYPIEVIG